jgi:hypothetical protein
MLDYGYVFDDCTNHTICDECASNYHIEEDRAGNHFAQMRSWPQLGVFGLREVSDFVEGTVCDSHKQWGDIRFWYHGVWVDKKSKW